MAPLNPSAAAWTPSASAPWAIAGAAQDDAHPLSSQFPDDLFDISKGQEMSVSPAELEELEEVEGWVNLMAELEGMEQDHLIELSLRHADKSKIAQIKAAALQKSKQKHGHGHHHGHHHKKAAAPQQA